MTASALPHPEKSCGRVPSSGQPDQQGAEQVEGHQREKIAAQRQVLVQQQEGKRQAQKRAEGSNYSSTFLLDTDTITKKAPPLHAKNAATVYFPFSISRFSISNAAARLLGSCSICVC